MMKFLALTLYLLATIMFIVFWDFLIAEQIFLSPQVKRSLIFKNKLVDKVAKRLKEIRKYQENLKTSQNHCLVLSLTPKMKFWQYFFKISKLSKFLYFQQRNYLKLICKCCDEFEQVNSGLLISYVFNCMSESI